MLPRKMLQHRQRECSCLATAGLGNAQQIPPLEQGRDGFSLNRGGRNKLPRRKRAQQRFGKTEGREIGVSHEAR
jgi:hypothetical protein